MTDVTLTIYAYLNGAWTDITSDTRSSGVSAEWGMSGNKPLDKLANTGWMRFSLNNQTGKYTPGGNSVIHADWGKGTMIKAVFTNNAQSYIRFRGVVDTIRIDAGTSGNRMVHCTVLDWMDYAANYPLNNPPIQLNQRADEAIGDILAEMPIQPQATDIDTGAVTFPTVFNDATLKTRAYSEFQKLILSEFGSRLYIIKDKLYGETLRFENSVNRVYSSSVKKVVVQNDTASNWLKEDGDALLKEDGDNLLLESSVVQDVEVDNSMLDMDVVYGDNLINRISVSVHPPRIDTKDSQIFKLDSSLFIDANDSKSFYVEFTEENSRRLVTALPPETNYPTTLFHFDEGGTEELIIDEGGKPWDDYGATLITDIKKVGKAALYLDGGGAYGGSYGEGGSSTDYEFGSGDFTVEWWEYRFNADANEATVSRDGSGGYCPWTFGKSNGTNSLVYITSNGSSWDIANGKSFGAISATTWVHYAITREGNTFRMFKNGTITDTWTSSATILASSQPMVIGKSGGNYITACIDEMRITKGYARYIANFTTTTEPFGLSGMIYAAWTKANGTGSELTADFDVNVEYGAAGAKITVDNTGLTAGYLTTLKIFGKIVENVSPVTDVQENQESIDAYGYHDLTINQPYESDFTSGREKASEILDLNRLPLVEVNKITMNANRDNAHMAYFLNTDVGDLVKIVEDQTETNAAFFIHKFGWNGIPSASGVNVTFWWGLEKHRENVEPLAITFADMTTNFNHVEFGYLPAVAIENVPYRIWSLWFNTEIMNQDGVLMGCFDSSEGGGFTKGYQLRFPNVNRKLQFIGTSGTTVQAWRSVALTNTPDTWFHILLAYDSRSQSNVPILYVNGVANTMTLNSSWITAASGETGTNLRINNILGDIYQLVTMKDIRIYNGDQVASPSSLAAALYNEGAYGEDNKSGLLFRAFYAPNNEISEYEGEHLTESQKLVDDIGFAIGTPVGEPLGVAI